MCNYAFTCVYVWNSQWSLLRLQFPQKVSLACVLLILFYSCSCYRTLAFDMNIRELLYHFSCFYFKFKVLKWLNSINPSIISVFGSQGQQSEQRSQISLATSYSADLISPAILGLPQGIFPAGYPWNSSPRTCPSQVPKSHCQPVLFDAEEQQLYSKSLSNDWAPHPFSKREPCHHLKETLFCCLFPRNYFPSFGQYKERVHFYASFWISHSCRFILGCSSLSSSSPHDEANNRLSNTWLHLHILSIKTMKRTGDKGQPWVHHTPETSPYNLRVYRADSQKQRARHPIISKNILFSPAGLAHCHSNCTNCKNCLCKVYFKAVLEQKQLPIHW